jgi:hypothetical protein
MLQRVAPKHLGEKHQCARRGFPEFRRRMEPANPVVTAVQRQRATELERTAGPDFFLPQSVSAR